MDPEIIGNDVLSDSQSSSTTPRSSISVSSDIQRANAPSRSNSFVKRQSSNLDSSEIPSSAHQQTIDQTSIKVLIFKGKCSKVFKSTVEGCVEDCILEFPGDHDSVYVSKSGKATQIPIGSNRNIVFSIREQSANARRSSRSNRQRNSITQHKVLFKYYNKIVDQTVEINKERFSPTRSIDESQIDMT